MDRLYKTAKSYKTKLDYKDLDIQNLNKELDRESSRI
jgi:hypothetical protein